MIRIDAVSDQLKASVIMTTYNSPRHLALAMAALEVQSELRFELHIADDGSTKDTADLVKSFAAKAPFPVIYSWQPDEGYRKTKILNEAIRKAKADYLIFIDGDCVVHHDFIKMHLHFREKSRYLAGRRVDLGPKISEQITVDQVKSGGLHSFSLQLILSCLRGDSQYWHRSIPVYNSTLRRLFKMDRVDDMKGCNFSVDRESVIKINGFDEDYEGYAREDTDLEMRLIKAGLKIKSVKGAALQYHVWHPRLPESESNKIKLRDLSAGVGPAICKNGLVKHPAG
jgi:glycosyltransferase involved in cell wall biosynthesis